MSVFKQLETAPAGYRTDRAELLDQIPWNDAGLIPAIAQDYDSGEVLMLAWMNRAALEETLATGRVCYWSRSRQAYWRKGESSGHQQHLAAARLDCDGDSLLLKVRQTGPACHTNRRSCFYLELNTSEVRVTSAPTV